MEKRKPGVGWRQVKSLAFPWRRALSAAVSCCFKPRAIRGEGALPRGPAATLAHVTMSFLTQVTTCIFEGCQTNGSRQAYFLFSWQTSATWYSGKNSELGAWCLPEYSTEYSPGLCEYLARAGVRGGLLHKLGCWNHGQDGTMECFLPTCLLSQERRLWAQRGSSSLKS